MTPYYQDDSVTLYHGDCREIIPTLGPVDHVITDPPYSERTHKGHDASANGHAGFGNDGCERNQLGYDALSTQDVSSFSKLFASISTGWIVWMTDHHLAPAIQSGLEEHGRYVFAPLPFYAPGSRVRLSGDGPSSWTIWIIVARTAAQSRWGTLPGGYVAEEGWRDRIHMGGKPLPLMTSLVRDYSRPGDLILDPFAGSGTTLEAAKLLGRRAIGIEREERHCETAANRLRQEVLL
jgi:23S rRNA G2445 N2-methylase RlmL